MKNAVPASATDLSQNDQAIQSPMDVDTSETEFRHVRCGRIFFDAPVDPGTIG